MAAGTALDPMTMPLVEDSAAQEFASIVATHRPQIFRYLLASTRDMDPVSYTHLDAADE